MYWPRLLREYPPGTLGDILPTDLYVKLDLFRDDLTAAINSGARPSPAFNPHTAPAGRPPNQRM